MQGVSFRHKPKKHHTRLMGKSGLRKREGKQDNDDGQHSAQQFAQARLPRTHH
jgi:hypothetical protein